MTDPLTAEILKDLAKPAIKLLTAGAVTGWRKVRRYLSPTILIAGRNSSGKTTLRNYFTTGLLPDKPLPTDETGTFVNTLVDITFQSGNRPADSVSLWLRDSRGFFDPDPLAIDIQHKHPVFIYFVFDVQRIWPSDQRRTIGTQIMKYEDVRSWAEKFKMRVQEHIGVNSRAKRKLCGGAVLINKCDRINEELLDEKSKILTKEIRTLFTELQPMLGFGEQRFDVFYTSMIRGKEIPRTSNRTSDLPLAIDFMFQALFGGGVIK